MRMLGTFLIMTLLTAQAAFANTPEISLRAFPLNTRELRKEGYLQGHPLWARDRECAGGCVLFWPIERGTMLFEASALAEKDPICKLIGAGCIVINYAEDPEKIWLNPEKRQYNNGSRTQFMAREISLRGVERANYWGKSQGSRLAKYQDFQEAERDDRGEFEKKLHTLDGSLKDETIHEFTTFVAEHPRVAGRLSAEFRASVAKDKARGATSDRTQALAKAITDVSLLMLEAFTKSADSTSPLYPYFQDALVQPGSLQDVDGLYTSLSAIGRWPTIRALTRGDREKLDPVFLETDSIGRYSATGVYLPDTNTVLIDLAEPFYDVVYTIYHELWHVAVYHSKRTAEIGREVQALLRAPESEESNQLIRHTLLRFFAEHELLAIDESSRLYRATGQLARQWGDPASSAQGWHDSYFGSSGEMNLFISHDMRKISDPGHRSRIPYVGFIFDLKSAMNDEKNDRTIQQGQNLSRSFPRFLASRTPFHLAHYKQRYLNDIESFDFDSVRKEFALRNQVTIIPETAHLSCVEVERLATALGAQGGYGIPFPFDVDGGWDRCPKPVPSFMGKAGNFEPRCSLPSLRSASLRSDGGKR